MLCKGHDSGSEDADDMAGQGQGLEMCGAVLRCAVLILKV